MDEALGSRLKLRSVFGASSAAWADAVRAFTTGRLDPAPLVTHEFPLDRFTEALALAGGGDRRSARSCCGLEPFVEAIPHRRTTVLPAGRPDGRACRGHPARRGVGQHGEPCPLRTDRYVPVTLEIAAAVATAARAHGYDALLLTGEEGPSAPRRVTGGGLAGAVILMDVQPDDGRPPSLRGAAPPAVLVGPARILDERPAVSTFVVRNETAVEPLLALLRRTGRAVPEDVSVVAVCAEAVAAQASVPLTSVAVPAQEPGLRAVERLFARLTDPEGPRARGVGLLGPVPTVRPGSGPPPPARRSTG